MKAPILMTLLLVSLTIPGVVGAQNSEPPGPTGSQRPTLSLMDQLFFEDLASWDEDSRIPYEQRRQMNIERWVRQGGVYMLTGEDLTRAIESRIFNDSPLDVILPDRVLYSNLGMRFRVLLVHSEGGGYAYIRVETRELPETSDYEAEVRARTLTEAVINVFRTEGIRTLGPENLNPVERFKVLDRSEQGWEKWVPRMKATYTLRIDNIGSSAAEVANLLTRVLARFPQAPVAPGPGIERVERAVKGSDLFEHARNQAKTNIRLTLSPLDHTIAEDFAPSRLDHLHGRAIRRIPEPSQQDRVALENGELPWGSEEQRHREVELWLRRGGIHILTGEDLTERSHRRAVEISQDPSMQADSIHRTISLYQEVLYTNLELRFRVHLVRATPEGQGVFSIDTYDPKETPKSEAIARTSSLIEAMKTALLAEGVRDVSVFTIGTYTANIGRGELKYVQAYINTSSLGSSPAEIVNLLSRVLSHFPQPPQIGSDLAELKQGERSGFFERAGRLLKRALSPLSEASDTPDLAKSKRVERAVKGLDLFERARIDAKEVARRAGRK